MNTPRIASGYTTRENYHAEYREKHREEIKDKKREWRQKQKALKKLVEYVGLGGETPTPMEQETEETGDE